MNNGAIAGVIICIIFIIAIIYVNTPPACETIWLHDAKFKTGDLICFKATDNNNSVYMMNYFTHIGIVVMVDDSPYIFEAFEVKGYTFTDSRHSKGILLTPLEHRIMCYKGHAYLKPLKHSLSPSIIAEFHEFIKFALDNMEYNYAVVMNAFAKWLGHEYNCKTNCAELVALSLVKLGLLDYSEIKGIFNHIRFTTNITNVKNNRYLDHIRLLYESVGA